METPIKAPTPDLPVQPEEELFTLSAERLRALTENLASRKFEALSLYEPLPGQDAFHRCKAWQRLIRKGNRAGGSVCAAVEFSRAALRCDKYRKYPLGNLLMYCIGYDQDHIGRVFHRLLFRPGAFLIIRDAETGLMRAYRPWQDAAREAESLPAPPLIPEHWIHSIAWTNKGERLFSVVRLRDPADPEEPGTEIRGFSSKSEPAQGDPVDVIWTDEDVKYPRWISEMLARLEKRTSKFFWSAFPHSENDALTNMSERALQLEEDGVPEADRPVVEFRLTMSGNPHLDKARREEILASMDTEEERRARDAGDFVTDSVRMYPTFDMATHGCPKPDHDPLYSRIDEVLASRQIPPNWCRYMALDPGYSYCAAILAAVPPPSIGDFVVLYDEIYLRNCDAAKFADTFYHKLDGQTFHAFIIDDHGSRIHTAGSNTENIREQFSREFKRRNIRSESTGSGFILGSDDRPARSAQVRSWLAIDGNGHFRLRVMRDRLPNVEKEFKRYMRQKLDDGTIVDVAKPRSRWSHAMNALEYLAAYNPKYVKPKPGEKPLSPAYRAWLDMKEQMKRKKGPSYVHLGAGKSA